MVDSAVGDAVGGDVEVQAVPRKGGMSGKKLVMILLPVLLLVGGGAGAYFSGVLGGDEAKHEEAPADAPKATVYYELPEMLVNLNSSGRKTNFLKLTVSLELDNQEAVAEIQKVLPRVVDAFQVYLRELRIDDLRGSAGLQRLREELLVRVNAAAAPVQVRDVLFKEMLVQ
ncbi:flagellar FliL protein [Tistlia consotensis]|uniref:Flagellar protein FliL n=1 Tax=Tistlia consotensis USBA 355 TaxID=560819 RepID=A0A1Y6CRI1_9PROT|nr:flagellar basal body-associated FliL family protein [Tistlia consotensis]SMF67972.1 flagellar FliL protein [Tistlia consotensis USBA 355]SNR99243.1 flagellar FliL protein [Tistlia consotensis]